MEQAVIHLENVDKIYGEGESERIRVHALRKINLSIKKGDFIALLGPSGSGKSTLMNLVGVLDAPTYGKVKLDEHDISKLSESSLAEIRGKRVGFVFQTFNLIPTLTALENVMLPMVFQKVPGNERLLKGKELLKKVNLSHRENHLPKELSGGEMQRVAIARALANNPEIILADEPTGNLDSKTGREIIEMLKKLNSEGKTIFMITHDLNLAKEAKKIIKIKDGSLE
jgi:putative ABC transport system ATP-binding protein